MKIEMLPKPKRTIVELYDFEINKLLIEFGYTSQEADIFMSKIMKNRTEKDKAQVVTTKLNDEIFKDQILVRDYDDVYFDAEEELYLMREEGINNEKK